MSLSRHSTSRSALPRTSIAIITYNQQDFIGAAIESALKQVAHEIIVIDDGSTDDTATVAGRFADDRLRVVTKANGGPSSALNAALDLAKGDVIVPFAGDDMLLPGSVADRTEILARTDADFVWSVPRFIDALGRTVSGGELVRVFDPPATRQPLEVFDRLWRKGNFISAASVAMTRRMWETVGPFDEDLWQLQDYDYWLRASAKDLRMFVGTTPFAAYRLHESNLSNRNAVRSVAELDKVALTALDSLDRKQLCELLFGTAGLDSRLEREVLKALLWFTHPRQSVSSAGREMLRILASGSARTTMEAELTAAINLRSPWNTLADLTLAHRR